MAGRVPRQLQQQDLQILRDYIDARKITAVIDRTFPLTEVPEAIRYLVEATEAAARSSSPSKRHLTALLSLGRCRRQQPDGR